MGLVFLYTGTGAGKTTSALGLALRCIGHGLKVVVIQFMKGRKDIGEYLVRDRLSPDYEIYQFGRLDWVNLKEPSEEDKRLAKKALEFAEKIAIEKKPFLLILDEINLAAAINLISVEEVLSLLSKIPDETHVVLTGRYAPPELINRADVVNLVVEVKYPKDLITLKGINY
ncbi:MAG: cob(I)yrinic acid a,c-diamide adenosyltransferase [Candidatus Methanomethylicota archaeon]|uniref:Cob(I)yrinic acid a,c-diamide adenosyltransferase n=1 Tax=Thermoproteota archaeon TaxID=2056631 RepID=A0A497F5D9_9CREN|nr:MAG: cob(I)yrinic acid a,c-diamide adenosyltransferase [Candidatus Verstraetearchaeota archaeon]